MTDWWLPSFLLFVALCLVLSFVGIWVGLARDAAGEEREKKRDEKILWLENKIVEFEAEGLAKNKRIAKLELDGLAKDQRIAKLEAEGLAKDRRMAAMSAEITELKSENASLKEELRRQMRPGTIQ